MDIDNLVAIDTHTHLEVSCRNPFDNYGEEYDRAADKYFRSSKRPTMEETLAYYRERKVGFVNFTVDAEAQLGRQRISNEEIAEAAMANSDIMIAFASIDPHKGKMGAREARRLIEEFGVKGFKFHPTVQGFEPQDKMAWPIYEVINEYQLPAIFHSGHSGIGSGMTCPPDSRICAATCSPRSVCTSPKTTRAPAFAKVRAISAPMPPAAPVTAATFPLKSIMLSPLRRPVGITFPTSISKRHLFFSLTR
jgi:predicted TIM-barrel fold metal-dependent hydrolase